MKNLFGWMVDKSDLIQSLSKVQMNGWDLVVCSLSALMIFGTIHWHGSRKYLADLEICRVECDKKSKEMIGIYKELSERQFKLQENQK